MEKRIFLMVLILLNVWTGNAYTQKEVIEQQLSTAVKKLDHSRTPEDLREARNMFEQLGILVPDEWLPFYYQAYTDITLSFWKWGTPEQEQCLRKAGECVDQLKEMKGLSKEAMSEIKTVIAYWYYAQIAVNPRVNAPRDNGLVLSLLAEAMELNPSNPRPIFIHAYFQKRRYDAMGGSYETYQEDLEKAERLYQSEDKTGIFPHWRYSE